MFAPLSCKLTALLTFNGILSGNVINLFIYTGNEIFLAEVSLNSVTFLCFFSYLLRVMYPLFPLKVMIQNSIS